jgi:hypothetical protein
LEELLQQYCFQLSSVLPVVRWPRMAVAAVVTAAVVFMGVVGSMVAVSMAVAAMDGVAVLPTGEASMADITAGATTAASIMGFILVSGSD